MALNRKYLGPSFPFTANGDVGYFVDMEHDFYKETKADRINCFS